MTGSVSLSAPLEDYLEAVFEVGAKDGEAHAGDIAKTLSVHKSTVTAMLKKLSDKGLINYTPYRAVTLTSRGRRIAAEIAEKHKVMRRFLSEVLLVERDKADATACQIEHFMDREVLERLCSFVEFVRRCPRGGEKWIRGFAHFCDHGFGTDRCERCMELGLEDLRKRLSKHEQEGEEAPAMTTLDQLKPGDKARIQRIGRAAGAVARRIADMGMVRGTPVEVVKVAPLGDPIEVKLKGYHLSLRKKEAAAITVDPE